MNLLNVIPFAEKEKEALRALAEQNGLDIVFSSYNEVTQEQVDAADIIVGNVNLKYLHANPKLKWIQLNSAGADAYCKPEALCPDTILTCATGAYGLAVSEYMLAVSLMLDRKLDLYSKNQMNHVWHDEGRITDPYQSTVLVLGLGDIGEEYAKRMKALGSYVIGVRRKPSEKPDWLDEIHTTEELDELIPRADYVSMVLPGTPETAGIMDERRLRMMKPTAYLINAGRGNAVDGAALDKVLREGVIAGAAIDVTDPEPLPADSPLWDTPRLILTPHIAGKFNLPETLVRINKITLFNLEKFLSGDTKGMKNIVDRTTGYRAR